MNVIYKNKRAEIQFSDQYAAHWRYPSDVVRALHMVNDFLRAANSFKDLADYRPLRLELLSGKLKNRKRPTGEWSIRIGGASGYRAILMPCDNEGNALVGGDILARASSILVIKISEVTNHYE